MWFTNFKKYLMWNLIVNQSIIHDLRFGNIIFIGVTIDFSQKSTELMKKKTKIEQQSLLSAASCSSSLRILPMWKFFVSKLALKVTKLSIIFIIFIFEKLSNVNQRSTKPFRMILTLKCSRWILTCVYENWLHPWI